MEQFDVGKTVNGYIPGLNGGTGNILIDGKVIEIKKNAGIIVCAFKKSGSSTIVVESFALSGFSVRGVDYGFVIPYDRAKERAANEHLRLQQLQLESKKDEAIVAMLLEAKALFQDADRNGVVLIVKKLIDFGKISGAWDIICIMTLVKSFCSCNDKTPRPETVETIRSYFAR